MLMSAALLVGAGAPAGWRSYVPSYPVSPIAPRSDEECSRLQQAFQALHAEVSQQHEDCLASVAAGPAGPTCTRAACQPLHDVRDGMPGLAQERVAGCRARVTATRRDQREQFVRDQERAANEAARQAVAEAEAAARAAQRDASAQRRRDADAARQRAVAAQARAGNAAATRAAHDQARKYFPNALPAQVPAPDRAGAATPGRSDGMQGTPLARASAPAQPPAPRELPAGTPVPAAGAGVAAGGDWKLGKLDASRIGPPSAVRDTWPGTRHIAVPEDPTSRAECEAFRDDVRAASAEAEEAHDSCLQANSGAPDRAGAGAAVCSRPACQGLHAARRELSDLNADGYLRCMRAVAAFERSAPEATRSLASASTMEQFRRAVMSGPLAVIKGLATSQAEAILVSTFGPQSKAVVSGLQKGIATTMLVQQLGAVQSVCRAKGSEALHECNAAIASVVRELGQKVPARLSSDPAIAVIQQGVVARLRLEMAATRRDIDRMEDAIGRAGKEDAHDGGR